MITEDQLRRIMPGANSARLTQFFPHLQAAMDEFEINTPLRAAAFLAQLAHESGQLRFMEEIWGPTSAQRRYEPVTSLSRTLGNTQPGDGFRFKGRGPIQLTGRANYQRFGGLLGLDLVGNPPMAATPEVAFRIAGLFWQNKGLNQLADQQNFREITRRINGGFNGLQDRLNFYARAKSVLGVASGAPAGASKAGAARPGAAKAGGARPGAAPSGGGFGLAPAEPADDGGDLSRGILPGDPEFARLLADDGAAAGAKKAGAKRSTAKKAGAAAKKAAKKAGARKSGAGTGAAKAGRKTAAGKSRAKKASAGKKSAARSGGAKKAGAKKIGVKKSAAKKAGVKKGAKKAGTGGAKKR
jgi:predicted chitinase